MDETAVFLGMSYFRLLGAHQFFGASLRGLAIDTAEETGEEFPRFTEFYIEKPGDTSNSIRLYALLESRRVTGAYEFQIQPGDNTDVRVKASLFLREKVKKLGLAPLTSMFLSGENRTRYFPDFRPEVHDSDGLLVKTREDNWLWRALKNPKKVHRVNSFTNVAAFGLLQRDRDFDHCQDLVARFERRPSYRVIPEGDWGPGRVELVEIPSQEERNDNIVTYWVPERDIPIQEEFSFSCTVSAFLHHPSVPPPNRWHVVDTRLQPSESHTRFLLDFGGGIQVVSDSQEELSVTVEASDGKLGHKALQPNEVSGGWRVVFDLIPNGREEITLQVALVRGGQPVSETWVYHYTKP